MRFLSIIIIFITTHAFGNVKLPKFFGDNMVLQRDQKITIWGWADSNEKIKVKFNKQTTSSVADKYGNWSVTLEAEKAGGPFQLIINGNNQIIIKNILLGDVWVCSGQSNMEWSLYDTENATEEIKTADYQTIRHFKIPHAVASTPQADVKDGEWKVCSTATAGEFTAVGYYFAKQLTKEVNIPIGLINTTWGGTNSETWTSREAFEGSEEFKDMIHSLPTLNLDSIIMVRRTKLLSQISQFQGKLETPENIAHWKEEKFNDTSWPKLQVPELWHGAMLENFDGTIWLRKKFTLDKITDKAALLELGMIDDSDDTYVNGIKVGEMKGKYNVKRLYNIPTSILKEGKNVIAVRVEDTGGGGGIYGNAQDIKFTMGHTVISLAGDWAAQIEQALSINSVGPNVYPSLLFNAMVNPLTSLSIKGVIWYQGETNAARAYQYRIAFPLLINDWRTKWKRNDLPFYFVQLSTFNENNGNSENGSMWAELREAQAKTLSLPHTAMVVTTDIGNPTDIHPRNKQDVGKRLARQALTKIYDKQYVCEGPTYKSMMIDGNKISILFASTGSGLIMKGEKLNGFEVAGADQKFYPADAKISGSEVILTNQQVSQPTQVRFGWADDDSSCNLFNQEGFPAVPFRTDSFKGITEGIKYKFGE
jgi:sialate O-acetylesterase